MSDVRRLLIIITPEPPSDIRSIFSNTPESIRCLLEHPRELRPNGWGLRTGSAVKSINGESLQTESFREVISLYRDGQFIIASRIDRDSLAWSDKTDSRIHPLAFVEFMTNALTFYRDVLADTAIAPQILRIEVRLENLLVGGGTKLPAGPINNLGWTWNEKYAPAASCRREIIVNGALYEATQAAFRVLREVYVWFGHADEDIPYTTGTGDDRRVDIAAIKAVR